jgi:ankyrin repeat protein
MMLSSAVRENTLPEIRRLMSVGADVNVKDNNGFTPLINASFFGQVQFVTEFLEHGADTEVNDHYDRTPLHWACLNDHLAVVIKLLGHGVNIDAYNSNGAPAILAKRKCRGGGANTEAKTDQGDTPLHWACWKGHLAIAKALLSGGANILAANNQGQLPIHKAVSRRKSEVAKYLLREFYARTRPLPLHDLLKDFTWIVSPNSSDVPPLRAALDENVLSTDDVMEILEFLVGQNPALLSSRDQDGSLPLHVACRRGASFTVVQFLVNSYKASVKSVTCRGELPLFLACEMSEPSLGIIFILVKLYPDLLVYR